MQKFTYKLQAVPELAKNQSMKISLTSNMENLNYIITFLKVNRRIFYTAIIIIQHTIDILAHGTKLSLK